MAVAQNYGKIGGQKLVGESEIEKHQALYRRVGSKVFAWTMRATVGLYGIKDTQVEAVSFGSEKPKAAGHEEAAWSQNRRADLVYPRQ